MRLPRRSKLSPRSGSARHFGAPSLRLFRGARAGVFTLLFAFFLTPSVHATLAVIVPARDGIVIAADSRLTFLGAPCDGAFKILIPARPARTAIVVTGDSIFVAPPPAGTREPCRYLATAPRLLDIGSIVTHNLEQQSGSKDVDVAAITRSCIRALTQFQRRYPALVRGYAGRDLFSVVIASYDPARATATLRNFAIGIDARTGKFQADRNSERILTPESARGIWIYGETGWVDRAVYAGPGRPLLIASTLQLLDVRAPIAATPRGQALSAAENVLTAAIRTARTNPPPTGIGGPIRVVFLGASRCAQALIR